MPTIYRVTTLLILTICLSSLLVSAQDPGDAASGTSNSTTSPSHGDNAAGAAGSNSGALNLSRGGMIAIILVAVIVGGGGIASATLFYIAKKRQWEIRKSLRRSARRLTGLGAGKNGRRNTANTTTTRRQMGISTKIRSGQDDNILPKPATRQQQQQQKDKKKQSDVEKGEAMVVTSEEQALSMKEGDGPKKSGFRLGKMFGR